MHLFIPLPTLLLFPITSPELKQNLKTGLHVPHTVSQVPRTAGSVCVFSSQILPIWAGKNLGSKQSNTCDHAIMGVACEILLLATSKNKRAPPPIEEWRKVSVFFASCYWRCYFAERSCRRTAVGLRNSSGPRPPLTKHSHLFPLQRYVQPGATA